MLSEGIGQRIREVRQSQGCSARELARMLEGTISQAGLSRIESGKKIPDAGQLLALSWALAVPMEDFLDETPLRDRVEWAARSDRGIDMTAAKEELLPYLRLRIRLDEVQVGR